jgi:hypothetical protein
MPEHPENEPEDSQKTSARRSEDKDGNGRRDDDLTIPPTHGRAGRGVASILPHLDRQQQINDRGKPAEVDIPLDGEAPAAG